ncbi:glycosyltransferase family 4 protein [Amylibacter sp.]|nr:glycosyltransferase family 4 protein [Amylibacter sp.]MDC1489170.1 glycosyltransferase family 4 protein [Amylibacter sp.]
MTKKAYLYLPKKSGGVLSVHTNLRLVLLKEGYVVHTFGSVLELLRLWVFFGRCDLQITALGAGILNLFVPKSLYIVHGFPFYNSHNIVKRQVLINIPRVLSLASRKTVAVSNLVEIIYSELFGVRLSTRILNCVDPDFFHYEMNKEKIIIYLGRIDHGKGIELLIEGFLLSKLSGLGYRLIIAGSGPISSSLEKKYSSQSIGFPGFVSTQEKYKLLHRAEVFSSMNFLEPMGIVNLEAIKCKCKLVVAQYGGHVEMAPIYYPVYPVADKTVSAVAKALKDAVASGTGSISSMENFGTFEQFCAEYGDLIKRIESE